jgi:alpha,alpha-trehalase
VASLAANDPFYAAGAAGPDRWNGPVCVPWEWLLVRGLRAYGETALADDITTRTMAAVVAQLGATSQFRELYDADDSGAANGSYPNYLWSSMAALMVLEGAGM